MYILKVNIVAAAIAIVAAAVVRHGSSGCGSFSAWRREYGDVSVAL
jgi:hypothetical protein